MRSTLYDARYNSRIPAAVGLCPDDTTGKLLKWINEASQVLLMRGLYWGTTGKYNLCVTNNCVTLPPQMACIEKVNVQKQPIKLRNVWFQFIENGPGSNDTGCNAQFIGNFPTFDSIDTTGKNITWMVDLSADVGKQALFLGYDENNNWIRTDQGGQIKDGVLLTGAQSPGSESPMMFSAITDIQFPDNMKGQSWLYQSDSGTLENMIGQYQYFETRPSYRRFRIPFLKCNCSNGDDTCRTLIEVIAKHEFIPVKEDTDYLPIGNLTALKWMVMAVKKYEEAENEPGIVEARAFEAMALSLLDSELAHYTGTSTDQVPNVQLFTTSDPIPTFI